MTPANTDTRILIQTPTAWTSPSDCSEMVVAASRAKATGILSAELVTDIENLQAAVADLAAYARFDCGIKCGIDQLDAFRPVLDRFAGSAFPWQRILILTAGNCGLEQKKLTQAIRTFERSFLVCVEVVSVPEAKVAEKAGAAALLLKGNESAGRIGEQTSFVLLQACKGAVNIPVWVAGAIGRHTAAAAVVAGASGLAFESQLLLLQESPLRPDQRERVKALDGTETCAVIAGADQFRLYARPGSIQLQQLQTRLQELSQSKAEPARHAGALRDTLIETLKRQALFEGLTPLGQDSALAAQFAREMPSVGAVVAGIRASVENHLQAAASQNLLAADSPLARELKTSYPILQGAMTRVSDTADFAQAVAGGGALPFLALALMRGAEIDLLLKETAGALQGQSWGVGILGFVPQALRAEQLEVVRKYKPPFALIAGGRPDQAAALEEVGIRTFLHVPSPLLLESFIESGARRFIFEGRECGGHVGPRSSFLLWEQMIEVLLEAGRKEPGKASSFNIIFAGGIHDALSAAMVATIAAPAAQMGMKVGVLLGTAYLFTEEAVKTGAIVPKFQSAAVACEQTVLFETGPGHAIRCLPSPYKETFDQARQTLEEEGKGRNDIRQELELMNLGRLRIASKGLTRAEQSGRELATVDEKRQWQDGMYMIGQVAALRGKTTTIKALHEDISAGSGKILKEARPAAVEPKAQPQVEEPIAIVGMSCLLPGAQNLETFWENILNKVDAITEVPKKHFDVDLFFDKDPLAPDKVYSRWGGFLKEIPFDPAAYGIPPASLASVDPMQMIVLEVVRAALADAGYAGRAFCRERTSVVVANAGHGPIGAFYALRSVLDWTMADVPPEIRQKIQKRLPEWTEDSFPGYLGNVIAGRVANRFDLGGINFCVDAACASSLAALYVGMRELRSGHSDVVLLTATDTHNQPGDYLSFSKTHALSPRGRCRTFDATADGIVISEGLAVLVLKRLADAERDGDRIYAVVRGIGGSSDGRDLSLTAPRPAGQKLAVDRAYADAGISPASVELVEAHGTGTVAGDKAEVEALTQVFADAGSPLRSCAIGSVKTMIGHTKCTAGVASIIKVAKALYHAVLPPTLGVETPNPACKFESSPFYINSETRPWLSKGSGPRRAGVSAFGFGGTNFHAVLEEYVPQRLPGRSSAYLNFPTELFVLKAATREALVKALQNLESSATAALATTRLPHGPLKDPERQSLFDLAFKLFLSQTSTGESALFGISIIASDLEDLLKKIAVAARTVADNSIFQFTDPKGIYFAVRKSPEAPKVALLFPGQGAQQVNMMRDLALAFPEVRRKLETADEILADTLGRRLTRYLYPEPAFSDEERKEQQRSLTDTRVAQSAVAAADAAAAALLKAFGLNPACTAGHSFGEYAALMFAGSMSYADLLHIAERRGAILQQANVDCAGSMTAVSARSEEVRALLANLKDVTLANINSPKQCIISGGVEALSQASKVLDEHKLNTRPIAVSAAFHSPLMVPARKQLAEVLAKLDFKTPAIPVYSNISAQPYPSEGGRIAEILAEHLVSPVEFQKEIESIYATGTEIFVECGPGSILTNLVGDILDNRPHLAVAIDRPGRHGITQLQHLLAQLTVAGVAFDLSRLYAGRAGTRVEPSLPPVKGAGKLTYLIDSTHIQRYDRDAYLKGIAQKPYPVIQYGNIPESEASGGEAQVGIAGSREHNNAAQNRSGSSNYPKNLQPAGTSTQPASAPSKPFTDGSRQNAPAVYRGNGNGGSGSAAVSPRLPGPGRQVLPAPGRAGSAKEQVILEFQRNMLEMTNSFLETQKRVMAAYLQADGRTTAVPQNMGMQAAPLESKTAFVPAFSAPASSVAAGNAEGNGKHPADQVAPIVQAQARSDDRELAPPAVQSVESGWSAEQLTSSLIQIVSERTGYPPDMLDPELDLEADLGIDSIKRVEILNSFRKLLPEEKQQELEGGIEKLAGTKTLKGIIDWISSELVGSAAAAALVAKTGAEPLAPAGDSPVKSQVSRALVEVIELDAVKPAGRPAGWTLAVCDDSSLAKQLTRKLEAKGSSCRLVSFDHAGSGASADEAAYDQVKAVVDAAVAELGAPSAVMYLALEEKQARGSYAMVRNFFLVLKALESHRHSQLRVLAAVLGSGDFGNSGRQQFNPYIGGIAGLVKTVGREWNVPARAVDLGNLNKSERAEILVAELAADDGVVEVGYRDGVRVGLEIVARPLSDAGNAIAGDLDSSSVVLVTGGARGITAELVTRLAEKYGCTFIIAGRSARPSGAESAATAGLTGQKELKAAIMHELKSAGGKVSVPQVEAIYQGLIKDREIRENLARIERAGGKVDYVSIDVRDEAGMAKLLDRTYELLGRIDAVIHGAGIIEDAFIKDKSPESFDRVFRTKVDSAMLLSKHLDLERLKYLIFLSSVVSRTGNAGQADYVAANETLNKLALHLSTKTNARVVSMLWGPWRGGMAGQELESVFARYGWAMIETEQGKRSFEAELALADRLNVEVLLVAQTEPTAAGTTVAGAAAGSKNKPAFASKPELVGTCLESGKVTAAEPGRLEVELLVDPYGKDFYLEHHKLDGLPVLPMAGAVELLMELAQSLSPHKKVVRLENLEIPAGIMFESGAKTLFMSATRVDSAGDLADLAICTRRGQTNRLNFRARAVFADAANCAEPQLPALLTEVPGLSTAGLLTPEQIYRDILFHGPLFQGIERMESIGPAGARGRIVTSAAERCVLKATRPWLVDPILLDSSMQLAGIWARQYLGIMALPTGCRSFHLLNSPSGKRFKSVIAVTPEAVGNELVCHVAVFDENDNLLLLMERLTAVGSKGLMRLAGQAKDSRAAR